MVSRPPSPTLRTEFPSTGTAYFSAPFERFIRDETGAFTLLDTMETFFDSRLDLLQRQIQKHSDRLKLKAEEALKKRVQSGDLLAENFDREVKNFKLKISGRMQNLVESWHSAKVVRTRDKLSFFFGVMSLLVSALLFGLAPQWIHISYTVQGLYLLPLRAYTYKKRSWHYFLFDLCYYVTILNCIYLWFLPSNAVLFMACYCLSHGSLASAVITWRNSLVFHDTDKVTSLFVHIYAPFTFTVIRHFYPNAEDRFPALKALPYLDPVRALLMSGAIYLSWQLMYWKFVLVDRRSKIASGQRTTSFSFLLNDKRSAIGRALSMVPPQYREFSFMAGQLVYSLLTELPAVFLLYDSPVWSGAFLISIFSVSVWNGGGFYIEVFGRKFERELEALRKELADSSNNNTNSSRSGRSSPTFTDVESSASSPLLMVQRLPATSLDELLSEADSPDKDKEQ
ncbi:hypothetical protein DEU56DRAFT_108503 [Suillus clintonianus]|uniref:uncharacterized protein n=1 Tax=Suillus clintonianus TaxID=1904413 RepID=UPI001B877DE5|nr:uncharacterized protein DEU56DRAFT_108503 [Suillus clintonianus]KAG2148065.1 hypothetical protein DEU56DRAFT_108503 [Suillus clintonianus]